MIVDLGAPVPTPRGSRAVCFFDAASEAFERAGTRVGVRVHDLMVGGARIRLRFAGHALEPLLLPPLEHLRVAEDDGAVALTVSLFDSLTTGTQMPAPAWGPDDYGRKGAIVGFNDDRIRTAYQPGIGVLNLYDATRCAGLYWVAEPQVVPWWEAPLRTLIHWWAAPTTLQPLHAGAVGRRGVGLLVVGHSGAGKSTTTLACLEAGMDYAGDDYVIVDVDEPTVHSLYSTVKLEPDNLDRFPTLAPLVANASSLESQKAIVRLHEHRGDRLVSSLRLRAILLPRLTGHRVSSVRPGSSAAALRVLAPTTSFHLPGYDREVVAKLAALVRKLPCYELEAGTDLEELAARVADLVES
jgi:hypothetical protein